MFDLARVQSTAALRERDAKEPRASGVARLARGRKKRRRRWRRNRWTKSEGEGAGRETKRRTQRVRVERCVVLEQSEI